MSRIFLSVLLLALFLGIPGCKQNKDSTRPHHKIEDSDSPTKTEIVQAQKELAAIRKQIFRGKIPHTKLAKEIRDGEDSAKKQLRTIQFMGGIAEEPPYLQKVLAIVLKNHPQARYASRYKFRVVLCTICDVEADSRPDGTIFLSRIFLDSVANEAELAGILGHEVTHVAKRHYGYRRTVENYLKRKHDDSFELWYFWISLGRVKINNETLKAAISEQEEQLEADKGAVLTLQKSGYNPCALSEYEKRAKFEDKKMASRIGMESRGDAFVKLNQRGCSEVKFKIFTENQFNEFKKFPF